MDEQRIAGVRRRVHRLREFYVHLAIYLAVIGGAALLNWIFTPTFWWVLFPAIGWGIAIAAHAISVIFEDAVFGSEWEERKTRELLQRHERHSGS
ncbi:MAG TPA: 2TM domain-containing protein [Candidatus Limnocylindria bacterium]